MKTNILVVDQRDPKHGKNRARTVKVALEALDRLPNCAWCRLPHLQPLCDVIQHGFQWDFIQTVCFCAHCCHGTVVEYEVPAEYTE